MYTVEQARKLKNKSQKEMASYLKMHVQTYRKIEKNPEKATIKQAREISSFLEVPYDEIDFFAS